MISQAGFAGLSISEEYRARLGLIGEMQARNAASIAAATENSPPQQRPAPRQQGQNSEQEQRNFERRAGQWLLAERPAAIQPDPLLRPALSLFVQEGSQLFDNGQSGGYWTRSEAAAFWARWQAAAPETAPQNTNAANENQRSERVAEQNRRRQEREQQDAVRAYQALTPAAGEKSYTAQRLGQVLSNIIA